MSLSQENAVTLQSTPEPTQPASRYLSDISTPEQIKALERLIRAILKRERGEVTK